MPGANIAIAGERISLKQAIHKFRTYSEQTGDTVKIYDRPQSTNEANNVLTEEEVKRTRVIRSHIWNKEIDWFLRQATTALWPPHDADLRDADPAVQGGLYDQLNDFYMHFWTKGVKNGKISKVLHIKRPKAFPILDKQVVHRYRDAAREAAKGYPDRHRKAMYWAAIRDDLRENTDSGAFDDLIDALANESELQDYAKLSELRQLDILTWHRS